VDDALEHVLESPIVTTALVRAAGGDDTWIRTARRRRQLVRIHRGVDVPATARCPQASELRAALALSPRAVLSGPSAARAHGLAVPVEWPQEITIDRAHSPVRGRPGLRVVARPVTAQTVQVAGMPVTSLPRTVADLLCGRQTIEQLWVLDQVLARGCSGSAIDACLSPGQRGVRTARWLLALGDPLSESALESAVAIALDRGAVPAPVHQFEIDDAQGSFVARVDFAWPAHKLALEADGAAFHDSPEALLRDRRRQNALTELGWQMLRCTWHDARHDPAALATLVHRCLRASTTTFH
jgi:hypothetical protein